MNGEAGGAAAALGYREGAFTCQDGLRLSFRDYGDARAPAVAVLCLAGLTRNAKDFHTLALHLAKRRRVLCPDYRGRGRSENDPDWRRYQPRTYVDDVRHLLAATNVHEVVVIGTSLGGILAMIMAAAMPAVLKGAVLNDVGPEIGTGGLARIIAYIDSIPDFADWPSAAEFLRKTLPSFAVPEGPGGWLTMAKNTFREDPDGRLRPDWDPAIMTPIRRGEAPSVDLWALFRALGQVPVLAVRGARSDVLTAETFERMASEVPALARVTVPDVGHVPTLLEPEVMRAIDALLERV